VERRLTPRFGLQRALCRDREGQRVKRSRVCDTESITDHLEHVAAVRLEGFAQNRVMSLAACFPAIGVQLCLFGAAFDIGKQEGDGTRREISHRSCSACALKPVCALPWWSPSYILLG